MLFLLEAPLAGRVQGDDAGVVVAGLAVELVSGGREYA